MNLEYVYEFVQLAQSMNYSEAADLLYITQSSLSKHIIALEKELGCKLFDRSTRKVTLTENGEHFLEIAVSISENYSSFCAEWYNDIKKMKQSVRIGSIPITFPYGIKNMLDEFSDHHSNIVIRNKIDETNSIQEALIEGRYDVIISRERQPYMHGFECIPLATDKFVLLINQKNPLAKYDRLSLKDIANEPLVMWQHGTQLYDMCYNACISSHFVPREVTNTGKILNIIYMVKQNLAIGFTLEKFCELINLDGVNVVQLNEDIRTYICLSYIPNQIRSEAVNSFISYMENFRCVIE